MIRSSLYNSTVHSDHSRASAESPPVIGGHLRHCLDYLRQAIICSADMTVEWAQVGPHGERVQIDGWGIPHRECKDVSVIDEWISKHRGPP